MKTKLLLRALVPLALATFANVSTASAEGYEVAIGGGGRFVPHQSMDALTADSALGTFDMSATMGVTEVDGIGSLEVGFVYSSGTITGTSFGRIDSTLDLDSLAAIGRIRRSIRPRLTYFGELGLGAQWGDLELEDADSQAGSLRDDDRAVMTRIGAGLDLLLSTPRASVFDLSVRLSAAYQVSTSLDFQAEPSMSDSEELRLETSAAQLGSVNPSGMSLGAFLVGRF